MSTAVQPIGNGTTTTTTSEEEELDSNPSDSNPRPSTTTMTSEDTTKWPGWPGHSVFRLIVPVGKVGSIIGRKGEFIKKMCEETRARIRVLEGPANSPDRIVLISAKEEPDEPLSPAMMAVIRVFKRVYDLPENDNDDKATGSLEVGLTSIRLLVASTQATNLIGKQGSVIKSIQESSTASVRVLSTDEAPSYVAADERIVDVQGEAFKVLKALEGIVGQLRKFLVDQSYNSTSTQDLQGGENSLLPSTIQSYPLSSERDSLFLDRETKLDSKLASARISLYGQDPALLPALRSSGLGRPSVPIVTQVVQTMQIPFAYAEDIIGIGGANIAYIRQASGATIIIQESRGLNDELTVEVKGSAAQVQVAQQLVQEFMSNHKEPAAISYGNYEPSLRPSYPQLGSSSYSQSPSISTSQPNIGYGSSSLGGGYTNTTFRL
ncbi:hypothetical protein ACFE04_028952 [Oxalis oulophora]